MLMGIALTSCAPGSDKTDETTPAGDVETTPQETTAPTQSKEAQLFVSGATEYSIMSPEQAATTITLATLSLREQLDKFNKSSGSIKIGDDFIGRGQEISPDEKVILIGYTNREESKLVYSGLCFGDYRVANVNGKIVIAAFSEAGFSAAITGFVNYLSQNIKDGSITIPNDFKLEGALNDTKLSSLPMVPDTENIYVHDMGDSCHMAIVSDVTAESFEGYKELLKNNDYTEYTTNKIDDNLFATYVNSSTVVTVYFNKFSKQMRINAEPISETALPQKEEDNKYTAITTTRVTQIGLERVGDTGYQNGMSYVFRLSDGSFIIYDGGFHASPLDAQRLNDVLIEQAPDKNNITIAAWFITHAHADHYGCFVNFFNLYTPNSASSRYKIETVIRNTPTEEDSKIAENTTTNKVGS